MRGLHEDEALSIALSSSPLKRIEAMTSLLTGRTDVADAFSLPVGVRDAALCRLFLATFGPEIGLRATCHSCDAELETDVDVRDLVAVAPNDVPAEVEVTVDGLDHTIRMPTTSDMVAVIDDADPAEALFGRCAPTLAAVPLAQVLVQDALVEADPMLDLRLQLQCIDCGEQVERVIDIVEVLDARIGDQVAALMVDIHLLARNYGWTERDVLAIPPARRRKYREFVTQ